MKKWAFIAIVPLFVLSGCSNPSSNITIDKSTTTSNRATTSGTSSNPVSSASPNLIPVGNGWYYTDLLAFGSSAQIVGLKQRDGSLDVSVERPVTKGNEIREVYKSAPIQMDGWTLGAVQHGTKPNAYNGAWSLKFGPLQYTKPIQITLVHNGTDVFTFPTSVPGYASEIMTDPAKSDNQVIGESGPWVWIAMKGPQNAPFPQMMNGFRYWNRIVTINTQTQAFHVYSIPPNTSSASTEFYAPAFTQIGQTVYVGTGAWVGVFPAGPSGNSMSTVRPEPQSVVSQDQRDMLAGLENEVQVGADGLMNYWNGYVMKGNQKDSKIVWEMDPAFWNHGSLPEDIDWAVTFPLKQGSQAYETRQELFGKIEALLKNPLDTAWVALDTPEKMKSYFHSTPPGAIPGYVIQGEYYARVSTPAGSSTNVR